MRPRSHFTALDLIAHKRDGVELDGDAIDWLVQAYTRGAVTDYQMSAFAMAVVFRGMTAQETTALTLAMLASGKRAKLGKRGGAKVDKHSTGGVGDKVSICLAPLMAACGLRVPMISGRGLGHTGGTLDKLEAIPGFRVDLPLSRFSRLVNQHGFALIGQTADLAPADRKLYALRDVTGTVESIPLITASILSKKLAEDLDALVLDVKVGRGAFMKTRADGRALAESLVRVGRAAGVKTSAVLTRMDAPLGNTVGNALETAEAFEVLLGGGPSDLIECTFALGAEMLRAGGRTKTAAEARRSMREAIASGRAAAKMEALVRAQGGDARVVREPDRLPRARHRVIVSAARAGVVQGIDAMGIAQVALRLGAGRTRADQDVDASVGVVLCRKPGERVARGGALAELHASSCAAAEHERAAALASFTLGAKALPSEPLVIERIAR